MRIAMFYHSLVSDWNHGNAHFLRGVVTELLSRGHWVHVYEPNDSWSRLSLIAQHGTRPIDQFHAAYPTLSSIEYDLKAIDLDRELDGVDMVIVHEWNSPELVQRIGKHHHTNGEYCLLFHDTHHRMVTEPERIGRYNLDNYDGVLAYGSILRELYQCSGRVRKAWTWHEAADIRLFHPIENMQPEGDLVWIGNWGDNERSAELQEFLIDPIKRLGLTSRIFGVRYPEEALAKLVESRIDYGGWLPNFQAPDVFARYDVTVHVPRRPYVKALPGIPTIRVFEALACGIPLICSPWNDSEKLFRPGLDYLQATNGHDMEEKLRAVLSDSSLAGALRKNGLATIRKRHTCAHRVDQLFQIFREITGTQPQNTMFAESDPYAPVCAL